MAVTATAPSSALLDRGDDGDQDHPGEELEEGPQAFMTRFLSFYEAALDSGRWFVWVAETDGRIVAHVWVYFIPKVPRPGRVARQLGYVTNVFAEPTARNREVGSHLLKLVVSWASRRGIEMFIVWPSSRSLPYYRRAGFALSREMLEREIAGDEG